MPIEVYQDETHPRVVRWLASGEWDIEQLTEAVEKSREIRATVFEQGQPNYTVIETTDDMRVPLGSLAPISRILRRSAEENTTVIRVGGSHIVRAIDTMFRQVFSIRASTLVYLDSLEEAFAYVEQQEASK